MSVSPTGEQLAGTIPFPRVAIIDDVYAGPKVADVKTALGEFCAAIAPDEEVLSRLKALTQCDFLAATNVTDEAVATLFNRKAEFEGTDALFLNFEQKRGEVERIRGYLESRGHDVKVFSSVEGLFDGEPFHLVFLDLLLAKGEIESEDIAKQICKVFKAFVVLMSNSPGAEAREEEFRRKSRLLRGFFQFYSKEDLDDAERLNGRLELMPKNHEVCHAVHEFVDSIDLALGGPIDEPPVGDDVDGDVGPLARFMGTLRTLGLQDYATLCELTLRDEGQPLGDYMMRLLGFHLFANLLADRPVREAVGRLDKMRFTEFLPFGQETTASFKMLYADSLTERVVEPWSSHPWQADGTPAAAEELVSAETGQSAEAAPEMESLPERDTAITAGAMEAAALPREEPELVQLLKLSDDGEDLPFLQLGDLLIRDEASFVYAILTASCDLQFTPEHVSRTRLRDRDDSVLLLPGTLRRIGDPAGKARATTGLIQWEDVWFSVEWFENKLLGLPHSIVRKLFQASNYRHEKRLQMGRALELQQNVISHVTRIGLDVQPPLPMDLTVSLCGRQADNTYIPLGHPVERGALVFHLRDKGRPVLVLRKSAFHNLRDRMRAHAESLAAEGTLAARGVSDKVTMALDLFAGRMVGMKLPIMMPETLAGAPVKYVETGKSKPSSIVQIWARLGRSPEIPMIPNKDTFFCLSIELA
ncbi:MAG: hypothetical protein WED34_09575 [Planctomycetales bacterium]